MKTTEKASNTNQCPICEQGTLREIEEQSEVNYHGHTCHMPLLYSECDICGSETASAGQTRANKRAMMAFKKEVDGLLTGAQVRALRKRLGMSQEQAARVFGGGPVAFSKYEKDDVAQSEPMNNLLRLAAAFPFAVAWLARDGGEADLASKILEQYTAVAKSRPFVAPQMRAGIKPDWASEATLRSTRLDKITVCNDELYSEGIDHVA